MRDYLDLRTIKPLKMGYERPIPHKFEDESGQFSYTIAIGIAFNGRAVVHNDFINFTLVKDKAPTPTSTKTEAKPEARALPRGFTLKAKRHRNPLEHVKFHISLPEADKTEPGSDFAKGYRIIVDILFKHRIASFKVIKPDHFFVEGNYQQRGKDFTIYCKGNAELNLQSWQAIMTEITEALVRENVRPGYRPELQTDRMSDYHRDDKAITGSNFITYRIERGVNDPVADAGGISIDVSGQLEPTPFTPPPQVTDTP